MDAMMSEMLSNLGIGDCLDSNIMEQRLMTVILPSQAPLGGKSGSSELTIEPFSLCRHSLGHAWMYAVLRTTLTVGTEPWQGTKWFYEASAPCSLPFDAPLKNHNRVGEAQAPAVALTPESVTKAKMKYLYVGMPEETSDEEDFLEDEALVHEEIEMDLRHPGDLPQDEPLKPWLNPRFQPVTTKACRHLYQIHFVTPEGKGTGDVVAAYPMQLAVRVDPTREMLIYDVCEHTPMTVQEFTEITKQRAYEIPRDYDLLTKLDDRNSPGFNPDYLKLQRMLTQKASYLWRSSAPRNFV